MTRIYYCCDVHGSEVCFRKALSVAKRRIYDEDVVLVSGDLTGKKITPIARHDGVYKASFLGSDFTARSPAELQALQRRIADAGCYPYVADPEEIAEVGSDPEKTSKLFTQLVVERMRDWIRLADQSLAETGIKFYMMPGNDDDPAIPTVLKESKSVTNPTSKVVSLDENHEMISMGATNYTPWHTFDEHSEEELRRRIETMMSEVRDSRRLIFNFHCPPYGSGLDMCPKLDGELRPVRVGSNILMSPAGSTAVREAIEKHQPKLGLFGHIHESAGETTIGRTVCLNPGSEYSQGILRGYVVDIDRDRVVRYFRVEG
ncbi:MAG: metallophosphoesterase [Conexivisphaerales archaeon]|jgi:Icc-related predicted phosphoesterase